MLFPSAMRPAIESGDITMTVRHWKRPQAKVGSRQRISERGVLVVDSIDVVPLRAITDDDARRSGFADGAALRAFHDGVGADELVHRIAFHFEAEAPPPPPSADLGDDDIEIIDQRLAGHDARSPVGPWTMTTLRLIADHPGRRAGDLAELLGRERLAFKADVRKLKASGLTVSLEVGYRLSARGEAYLRRTRRS